MANLPNNWGDVKKEDWKWKYLFARIFSHLSLPLNKKKQPTTDKSIIDCRSPAI